MREFFGVEFPFEKSEPNKEEMYDFMVAVRFEEIQGIEAELWEKR